MFVDANSTHQLHPALVDATTAWDHNTTTQMILVGIMASPMVDEIDLVAIIIVIFV